MESWPARDTAQLLLCSCLLSPPPAMTETREPAETGGYASLEEDDEDLSPGEMGLEVVVSACVSSWFGPGPLLRNLDREWFLLSLGVLFSLGLCALLGDPFLLRLLGVVDWLELLSLLESLSWLDVLLLLWSLFFPGVLDRP